MPAESPKPTRKPRAARRDFKAERERLIMHCRVSLDLITAMIAATKITTDAPDGVLTHVSIIKQLSHQEGQIAALKGVLKLLGETE